ncbi:type II toxin-antitoxin system RelE/ParE family toxin [sulfur-oxidizing endosymbiont of Gigantopelta aegis]|uniref:type II toxin-antitoxin system RelE/ParE family toxin n=1 Tax=sulfur-oxidizing endosymbiont of Gigantopelta aegis TaxID=2794934 RepID=UPI001FEB8C66|nr:type II toxin-antitoxin system RelE/ParE family toxin [sulfur-oxidizing endosymbiont of Gigantopelta aegis]
MDEEIYRELQNELIESPDTGKIITGSGSIRKIRWSGSGRGKRGGSRIIYYWEKNKDQIYMLFIYEKNELSDLTKDQLSALKNAVELEFGNG